MPREKFGCENPKCKSKGVEEVVQLSEYANLLPYALKNKKTQAIDEKKLATLKRETARWRCEPCFATFLRRKAWSEFYHLIESEEESDAKEQRQEEKVESSQEGGAITPERQATSEGDENSSGSSQTPALLAEEQNGREN